MLVSKGNYIFRGINEVSKNGKVFRFVNIADSDAYETYSFFADNNLIVEANPGDKVNFEISFGNFNRKTTFNIVSVKVVR